MSADQQTEDWMLERLGHASASRASDILAKIRTGESASRRKYRIQLTTERLTKKPTVGYQNAAMQWGIEQEPYARMAYAAKTGADVEQVGFIKHAKMLWCGASPDGLIGVDGMVEIKCPESATHLEWLEQNRVPPEHIGQIQFQLWVTGRLWNDFVSFDPRFPEHLQLFVIRAPRDDKFISELAAEVGAFLVEVDSLYNKLMGGKS